MGLQEKLAMTRTRAAEVQGERVQVRVYSRKEWAELSSKVDSFTDQEMAEFLAGQFLDDNLQPVLTPEFLQSDDCPTCVAIELVKIVAAVNTGTYEKK